MQDCSGDSLNILLLDTNTTEDGYSVISDDYDEKEVTVNDIKTILSGDALDQFDAREFVDNSFLGRFIYYLKINGVNLTAKDELYGIMNFDGQSPFIDCLSNFTSAVDEELFNGLIKKFTDLTGINACCVFLYSGLTSDGEGVCGVGATLFNGEIKTVWTDEYEITDEYKDTLEAIADELSSKEKVAPIDEFSYSMGVWDRLSRMLDTEDSDDDSYEYSSEDSYESSDSSELDDPFDDIIQEKPSINISGFVKPENKEITQEKVEPVKQTTVEQNSIGKETVPGTYICSPTEDEKVKGIKSSKITIEKDGTFFVYGNMNGEWTLGMSGNWELTSNNHFLAHANQLYMNGMPIPTKHTLEFLYTGKTIEQPGTGIRIIYKKA